MGRKASRLVQFVVFVRLKIHKWWSNNYYGVRADTRIALSLFKLLKYRFLLEIVHEQDRQFSCVKSQDLAANYTIVVEYAV